MCTDTLEHTTCLFEQPWWLDAVAPGQWREVTIEKGGEVYARMVYGWRKRFGLTLCSNPPLAPTLGPWLRPTEGKYSTRLAMQHELLENLIQRLPSCDLFSQNLSSTVTNILPFHWRDYDHSLRYTYRLSDLSDPERLWHGFSESCRRAIRKATRMVTVKEDLSMPDFYKVFEKTWSRQGRQPNLRLELLERLDQAFRTRGSGKILHAEDPQGNVHAAICLVWDERSAFYLAGGADPEFRGSGAHSLLMWSAIQLASEVSRAFDFEGSMSQQIERFFRSFGAQQTVFVNVRKISRRLAALTAGKDFAQSCLGGKRLRWFF